MNTVPKPAPVTHPDEEKHNKKERKKRKNRYRRHNFRKVSILKAYRYNLILIDYFFPFPSE